VNPAETSTCRRCSVPFSPSVSSKPPAPPPALTPSVPTPKAPTPTAPPAAEKAAPFERRVVGPVYVGFGQHYVLSSFLRRFFYCVCLEDALIFVPRPWVLGAWPARLVAMVTACACAPAYFLHVAHYYRDPLPFRVAFIALCVGVILCGVLFVYRLVGDSAFRKRLASAPPREIPGSDGPSRVELSTVRSLKTNSWRLLLVREGEEDFAFRIPWLDHHEVESALGKAYPELWKRES
jgi:hypothetical protein